MSFSLNNKNGIVREFKPAYISVSYTEIVHVTPNNSYVFSTTNKTFGINKRKYFLTGNLSE
jgi:hypothetical protein